MLSLPQRGALPGGVAVHLESRHHQLAVRAVLHVGSHREPLASAGWRTRPSSGARRRGQRRGGGAMDVAVITVMRDGLLRVSEGAAAPAGRGRADEDTAV